MKKPESRSDEAYQQIKLMLLRDQLQPGQKLRYQEIAKGLGMSQTPVMLALVRLENDGLVRSRPNRGYYVPEIDLEEAKELYDIRLMVEVPLLGNTVETISDQQIAELEELLESHAAVREGSYSRERIWRDARFHLALAACSGHRVALNILRRVFDLLYLRYRPPLATTQRIHTTEREHREFFEALTSREPERCMAVMRDHIEHGRQFILESLPSRGEPQEALHLLDE
ncbi:MAG: GntR family transcriptional regulator [Desulfarculaceae bacterium]|nr:GntR family transcriptional regulator [Desulfarculaceae bacterium]MCF8071574.1 GntR family transcriptional regulator [Desulfarculaceae bacterium]MCF8102389.1 GntR family transcriptional regulator [Desulfarculaceae bacterium]MCF8114853.1 GntR family transcriptional regulator [Desulfarculaceae bacterium]